MDRVRERIKLNQVAGTNWSKRAITIGVLDSGIGRHPDLEGRCMVFRDFVNQKTRQYDDNGHGTHVCGILCGSGEASNGKYKGIIPSARLVVGKVLEANGEGKADVMLEALEWILYHRKEYDIRLLNISVGIGNLRDRRKTELLKERLERIWDAGIVVVCAAGNKGPGEGSISDIGGSGKLITVGCYDDIKIVDGGDSCENYSGRGLRNANPRKPNLVAPGSNIISCNYNWSRKDGKYEKLYEAKSGTSMAVPIVTGCAGLLLCKEPYLSNEKVKERLQYTAEDLGKPWNQQGWGMIDGKKLLEIPETY